MVDYRRTELIKKSVFTHISNKIPTLTNLDYVIGDGSTNLLFYFAFPSAPEVIDLHIPSISLDEMSDNEYKEYDIGNDAKYPIRLVIDIFGQDNRERDYLAGLIKEIIKDYSVPYLDYNATGACVGYIRNSDINGHPIRIESDSAEQEYRYSIDFISTLIDDYIDSY